MLDKQLSSIACVAQRQRRSPQKGKVSGSNPGVGTWKLKKCGEISDELPLAL